MISKPRCRWPDAFLLALIATGPAQAAPASLADLLRSLAASGYDILYSSDLVSADLTIPDTLHETDPLARAREALAAYHLTLRSDGQKRYVVTRSARAAPAAEPDHRADPNEHLDEVAVFASRYVLEDQAAAVQSSFGHDDLEQVPGAQGDVMRAVRTVPGLANNLSSRPYVRGAFLEDVLVRFDGIPMVDPFHFKNFQNLVSAFDPATVERMDVYTGGFPVKFGTRTAATFDIAPREVESGYEHRVGANLLSYDLSSVGRSDNLPIEWLATARHSTQKITLQPTGGDIGEPSYSDALGRLRWQVDPSLALIAGWLLLDDEVSSSTDPSTEQAVAHDRDVYGWLAAEWAPSGSIHSRTSLAVASSERSLVGDLTLPGAATGTLDEQREISTFDLRSDWTYVQTGSLLWEWGAESTFETTDLNFSRQESLDAALAASLDRPADATLTTTDSPSSIVLGAFASVRHHWRLLEIELGVRADYQDYRSLGAHSQLSPRFNLRFDPTSDWHLYGSWGHFRQAQRVDEWRSEVDQTSPDPATHVVELIGGVAHDVSTATHWRIEAYYNHWLSAHPYLDNELNRLSLVPELGLDRVLIAPRGGDSTGVELSLRQSFGTDWAASMSYILSKSTDELATGDVLRSWDQTQAFNADVIWKRGLNSASLVVGWHSGWPMTPIGFVPASGGTPAFLQIGARNTARWDSYFSADVRVARTVPLRLGEVLLWADATNVTNRDNECCTAYGQTDSRGNLLPTTTASWFPRVLNVGFEWRIKPKH